MPNAWHCYRSGALSAALLYNNNHHHHNNNTLQYRSSTMYIHYVIRSHRQHWSNRQTIERYSRRAEQTHASIGNPLFILYSMAQRLCFSSETYTVRTMHMFVNGFSFSGHQQKSKSKLKKRDDPHFFLPNLLSFSLFLSIRIEEKEREKKVNGCRKRGRKRRVNKWSEYEWI